MEYLANLFKGGLVAIGTIIVSSYIPETLVYPLFALLLAFAGGINLGFLIAETKEYSQELLYRIGIALLFPAIALAGLWKLPLLIAVGWAIHGVWDLLTHLQELQKEKGNTYPLLCLSYDFIVAWYVFYYWVLSSYSIHG